MIDEVTTVDRRFYIMYIALMIPFSVSCAEPLANLIVTRIRRESIRNIVRLLVTIAVVAINLLIIMRVLRIGC